MSKERVGVADTVQLVLTKADGTIIINEPTPITADRLREIADGLDENNENREHS